MGWACDHSNICELGQAAAENKYAVKVYIWQCLKLLQ